MGACPFDPADKWDEDDGYEYDDTKPAVDLDRDGADYMNRPDYVGIVSGAQYKLENAEGVTEYALIVVSSDGANLYEMSQSDLEYLGRQIDGLLKG